MRSFRIGVLLGFLCVLIMASQPGISYGVGHGAGEGVLQLGRAIDVYTQKVPYSGWGPNQPSDAFAPQDEVVLYAYVTYNGDPVQGKIVAFEVHGPINPVENVSFTRTAVTDVDGIANVSFRIPWPDYGEEVVFGIWNVVAIVDIAEVAVEDRLTFEVGWIIELLRVETVDANNVSKTSFMKSEHMSFRLKVRNIAMTDKVATFVIDVYDNCNVSLGQVILEDERVSPGVKVYFIKDLLIPTWACLGVGEVYANAYTALPMLGGVPWCPQVSTTFRITKLIVHDVAVVSVVPSSTEVFACETVNITVVVRNEGDVSESFDVGAYYDSVLIGTLPVKSLVPQMESTLIFVWCTSCVPVGDYTISAVASVVSGEVDVEDNRFVDGVVRIKPYAPPPVICELPGWLLPFLFILAVLVGANFVVTVVFLLWWLKRKSENTVSRAPTSRRAPETRKLCSECGREFSAGRTFCPYCFAYQR